MTDGTASAAAAERAVIERTRAKNRAIDAARTLVTDLSSLPLGMMSHAIAEKIQALNDALAHHDAVCEPTPSMFGGFDH